MISSSSSGNEMTTFRDPAGSVLRSGDRIFRVVRQSGRKPLDSFLRSSTALQLLADGNLVGTKEVCIDSTTHDLMSLFRSVSPGSGALYEHSPVWFPSYPYEWAPEMLYSAAMLTLDIAAEALREGFGLKDATPFNILFDQGKPVFVDLCSFEERAPNDPIWLACAQFERMFLLPLLASRHFGMDPESVFSANLDGLDADKLYRWFRFPQMLSPSVMKLVAIPHWMNRIAESELVRGKLQYQKLGLDRALPAEDTRRLLDSLFRNLRSKLIALRPPSRNSVWSGYDPEEGELAGKKQLVERVFGEIRPRAVLDIGCNSGVYSRIAAGFGARVVAVDSDSTVVGRLWNQVADEKLDILPLVANFARPSPGMGWRNAEYLSFAKRAGAKFDAVLMLAVLHHIVVRDRIPLEELFEAVAGYTKHCLIIEFVANQDAMFQRISSGRESLFIDHTEEHFVAAAGKYFEILERCEQPSGTRVLFVMRRRG